MKQKIKKYARPLLWCAFALYLLALVCILFVVPRSAKFSTYELYFRYSTNFIPFKTIFGYIGNALQNPSWLRLSTLNILGNLVLFLPMGAFLPCLCRRFDRLWKTTLAVAAMVVCAEGLQMLLLVGILDVDDFILNVPGAAIGYGLTKIKPINNLLRDIGVIRDDEINFK